jgi:hypothetical protein
VDRPSQEPAAQPDGAESPLSFPVEAPRPAGPEPGAGVPQAEPLRFPAEASWPEAPSPGASQPADEPLRFPAEAPRPEAPPQPAFLSADGPPQAQPLQFPGAASAAAGPPFQPAELPYPVAQLPGAVPSAEPPPPPPAAAEPPLPPPALASFLRFAPPVLAVAAAFMTALGAFLPLFTVRERLGPGQRFLDAEMLITETAWGHTYVLPNQEVTDQPGAPVGAPVLFAAVLLVAAALVAFSHPERRLGRWLIAAGAVFTAGVVTTVGTSGIGWSALARRDELTVTTGPGMWLLIGGTAAAAAAAVIAYLPRRQQPGWADPALAYADTPTPPSGVAITVLPPDDEQP